MRVFPMFGSPNLVYIKDPPSFSWSPSIGTSKRIFLEHVDRCTSYYNNNHKTTKIGRYTGVIMTEVRQPIGYRLLLWFIGFREMRKFKHNGHVFIMYYIKNG